MLAKEASTGARTWAEFSALLHETFGSDVIPLQSRPHCEDRGRLAEFRMPDLPFQARRVFTVADVPAGTVRGRHRHRVGHQALFCVAGLIEVGLRRGPAALTLTLTPTTPGLCIAPGVWAAQRYVLDGSVLLAMASDDYDPAHHDSGH